MNNIYQLSDKEFKEKIEHFINSLDISKDKITINKETFNLKQVIEKTRNSEPGFIIYIEAVLEYLNNKISLSKDLTEEAKQNFRMFMIPHQNFKTEIDKLNATIKQQENEIKLSNKRVEDKDEEIKRFNQNFLPLLTELKEQIKELKKSKQKPEKKSEENVPY